MKLFLITLCITALVIFLSACGTTVGKLNPSLTSLIPDATLEGETYDDGIRQNVERKGIVKRFNCRTYLLRKEKLPAACQ